MFERYCQASEGGVFFGPEKKGNYSVSTGRK